MREMYLPLVLKSNSNKQTTRSSIAYLLREDSLRRHITLILGLLLSFSTLAESNPNVDSSLKAYRLNSGDKIAIRVFDEAELSVDVILSDSGSISYPFLGELKFKGLSLGQLENEIIEGLKNGYLIDPKVTVSILEYRPFFIHGEVKQSGGYPYQPGLTLRKAVTLAGGFTERASKNKITVIRDADQNQDMVRINMDDLIQPGDTITVEQSLF